MKVLAAPLSGFASLDLLVSRWTCDFDRTRVAIGVYDQTVVLMAGVADIDVLHVSTEDVPQNSVGVRLVCARLPGHDLHHRRGRAARPGP